MRMKQVKPTAIPEIFKAAFAFCLHNTRAATFKLFLVIVITFEFNLFDFLIFDHFKNLNTSQTNLTFAIDLFCLAIRASKSS